MAENKNKKESSAGTVPDGRRLRSERSKQAIIDASLELMEEVPRYREEDDYALYLKSVGLGHIQHIHGVRHLLYMLPQRSLIPEEHHGTK